MTKEFLVADKHKCKDCGTEFEPAITCPQCGTFPKGILGGLSVMLVVGIVLITFLYFLFSSDPPKQTNASRLQAEELKELVATTLNLGGHLCAKVTNIRPLTLENRYEVTCIEYRGGGAKVTYIFDAGTGKAFRQ